MQVTLIEVNTCPALAKQGAVLEDLLPRVVEEAVQKAVDPLFPVPAPASAADTATACGPPPRLNGFEPLALSPLKRSSLVERSLSLVQSRSSVASNRASAPCLCH